MKLKHRISAIGCAVVMIMMLSVSAFASVDLNAAFTIESNAISGWPQAGDVVEAVGAVMEAETGTLVYSKGADALRYPASITKLMTLLVAVENSSLTDQVTFTETMLRDIASDSSNIGMQVGEIMSMEACLNALMIQSANEVATQIAEYVGGTEQNFVNMMNEKAAELGCKNTHFNNANGLPDENHYTTARDMALIVRAGLKNPTFRQIVGSTDYTIPATNLNPQARAMHTHHPLLAKESTLYYEGVIGGKTGNSAASGKTLVTIAERNGTTYIAVLMYGPDMNTISVDCANILNYAFGNFTKVEVPGGYAVVPSQMTVSDLRTEDTEKGNTIIRRYYLGNYRVGTGKEIKATPTPTVSPTPIATPTTIEQPQSDISDAMFGRDETENSKITNPFGSPDEWSSMSKILLKVMIGMAAVLVVLIVVMIIKDHRD
ncbi:MAG: D-alanyl-D-alanine carboxypeptidase family protein [Eubacteriales bacterium]|nr:D-alanyl-D-alanine carboxypeptidase family protein [Eubacteriales bacterium]